jgi:hypothetical protein
MYRAGTARVLGMHHQRATKSYNMLTHRSGAKTRGLQQEQSVIRDYEKVHAMSCGITASQRNIMPHTNQGVLKIQSSTNNHTC